MDDARFFGHPRAVGLLCVSHGFDRLAFYGVQSVLMLYMLKALLLPGVAVPGLAALRAALAWATGPSDLAFASAVLGLFSGLVFIAALGGAWVTDRGLGRTRAAALGLALITLGYAALAAPALFLPGLAAVVVGQGLAIPNVAAQLGGSYAPTDPRRTRGFGLLLIALNVGALASALVVGTLAERVGWAWGFAAAAMCAAAAFVVYASGRRALPADPPRRVGARAALSAPERRAVGAILLTFAPNLLAFAAVQQAYGIMLVWADANVDRDVGGFTVPVTWALTFDGLGTILGTLLAVRVWAALERRGREPDDLVKLAIGCALGALGWVYMAAFGAGPGVALAAWLGCYVLLDIAIPWQFPPGYALAAAAPAPVNATMLAGFNASTGLGYFLLGWLGRFFEPLGAQNYWLLLGAISAAGAALAAALRPWGMRAIRTAMG